MVFGLGTFWKSYRRGDINDFAWQHCRSSDGGTGMTENPGPGAWNADPVVYTGWKCTFSCTMRQSRNRTLILALAGLAHGKHLFWRHFAIRVLDYHVKASDLAKAEAGLVQRYYLGIRDAKKVGNRQGHRVCERQSRRDGRCDV